MNARKHDRYMETLAAMFAAQDAEDHAAYAKSVGLPRPGYTCGPHAITFGGGCFNCGWRTGRDTRSEDAQATR